MRLGVIGINERVASVEVREKLATICKDKFTGEINVTSHIPLVLLSTCNRTELYFSTENLAQTHSDLLKVIDCKSIDQKLYSFFGKDCLQHLIRVAAGLDSAIIAETEIQGQVRAAYQAAKERPLPHDLHFAFQKALKVSKQIRRDLPACMPNIEHAVLSTACEIFTHPKERRLLFVGASEINCRILRFFLKKGIENITLCNRSTTRAQKIATEYNIALVPWSHLSLWREYDWVIFGTKAHSPLIRIDTERRKTELIIDLGVPRNVFAPKTADALLWNIDQIQERLQIRRELLASQIQQAEGAVVEMVTRLFFSFQRGETYRELLA